MGAPELQPGELLQGTYQIVRSVGKGGMGEVFEATHARLAGRYAIKILLREFANNADAYGRFLREAEVTSGLRHPNIVQVIDFNKTPDGAPYLVMEFLEGIELHQEIRRVGAMSIARVLNLVEQIALGLSAAHRRGVVHRDLKPQNVFLLSVEGQQRDFVKVMDFGISKVRKARTALTQQTAILGTPQYMSPEQALGQSEEIDHRSDQFALAAITYELLGGRAPFKGETAQAVLFQVVYEQPRPLMALNPAITPSLAAVVARGMAKKASDRYPDVLSFYKALYDAAYEGVEARTPVGLVWQPPAPPPAAKEARTDTEQIDRAQRTTFGTTAGETLSPPKPPFLHRRRAVVLGAAGVVAAAGFAALISGSKTTSHPRTAAAAGPGAVRPTVSPIPTSVTAPAAPAPPPEPGTVVVEVEKAPPGVRVTVDGRPTTLPVRLPRGSGAHALRFEAPGYQPAQHSIDGTRDRTIVLQMRTYERARRPVPKRGGTQVPARAVKGKLLLDF